MELKRNIEKDREIFRERGTEIEGEGDMQRDRETLKEIAR